MCSISMDLILFLNIKYNIKKKENSVLKRKVLYFTFLLIFGFFSPCHSWTLLDNYIIISLLTKKYFI